MGMTPVHKLKLKDAETVLVSKRETGSEEGLFYAMSGDTSSPANGGHRSRGLPPSAALRWLHYHFVSPVHQKNHPKFLWVFVVLSNIIVNSPVQAEFSYQNPARSALDEAETKATSVKQFTGNRFQRQQALAKLQEQIIEKEMNRIVKEHKKVLVEADQDRQRTQRFLETEKQRASQKTQQARAQQDAGFEYYLEENFDGSFATIELLDGLPARITGETVKDDFGAVSKRNREMTYYGKGKYYRLPQKERAEVTTSTGEKVVIEVVETVFEKYPDAAQWWHSRYTGNYAFPTDYTTTSQSSLTPYKMDVVKVRDAQPRFDLKSGKWLRDSWVEESATSDDPGVIFRRQVFKAGYDEHDNLATFFGIVWSPKAKEQLVLTEYDAKYLRLPDGREKVDTEKITKTQLDAATDPKLMTILEYVTKGELVPFELVNYAYGIAKMN